MPRDQLVLPSAPEAAPVDVYCYCPVNNIRFQPDDAALTDEPLSFQRGLETAWCRAPIPLVIHSVTVASTGGGVEVKAGCHALNEDYYYHPVDDETRLRPVMIGGCRADLDSGDPIRARLWRGTPERARLKAALQDEESDDSYRLRELLEEIHGAELFSDYTYGYDSEF